MQVNFLPRKAEIEAAAEWMLSLAKKRGAWGADLLYSFSKTATLDLRDGRPEECSSGHSGGIGVRTIAEDGRQGVAFSSREDRASLDELVSWSLDNCTNSEPEDGISLYPGPLEQDESLDQFDEIVALGIAPHARMDRCEEMTRIAGADPRVVSVRSASWSDGYGCSYYASTEGVAGWKRATFASGGAAVVLRDGDRLELGAYGKDARFASDVDYARYARMAVERTGAILGGKSLPTGRYSLILPPEAASSLIYEIGELFSASEVHRGRSLMKGRLGQKVAASVLTLVDDARVPRAMGSEAFDGEGVPTGQTTLIDKGIAHSYLYNMQYAKKDGVTSTGNASRSAGGLPDVGTSNLMLLPGKESPESLAALVSDALFVVELMGLHTIDPISGDFSLGAKGVYMKNGVEHGPVSGVTIAGNLSGLLERVAAVGNDSEFFGTVAAPTLIVEDMPLAGG